MVIFHKINYSEISILPLTVFNPATITVSFERTTSFTFPCFPLSFPSSISTLQTTKFCFGIKTYDYKLRTLLLTAICLCLLL